MAFCCNSSNRLRHKRSAPNLLHTGQPEGTLKPQPRTLPLQERIHLLPWPSEPQGSTLAPWPMLLRAPQSPLLPLASGFHAECSFCARPLSCRPQPHHHLPGKPSLHPCRGQFPRGDLHSTKRAGLLLRCFFGQIWSFRRKRYLLEAKGQGTSCVKMSVNAGWMKERWERSSMEPPSKKFSSHPTAGPTPVHSRCLISVLLK